MTTINRLLYIILIIYILFGFLLYIKQRNILYLPSSPIPTNFKEVYFDNNGTKIKTFVIHPKQEDAVIYFGGNAENVAYSVIAFEEKLKNHSLYFINYRGYGGSEGKPTEKGIYSDALFIYDQIKKHHKNISIIGRSLGSGVATYLASKRPIKKLVLVTPFDSIRSVAQEIFPIYPMNILLKDRYDSLSRVFKITTKEILIIQGAKDKIVPPPHTQRLFDAFKHQAPLSTVDKLYFEHRGHNDIDAEEQYYLKIKDFIEEEFQGCIAYAPKINDSDPRVRSMLKGLISSDSPPPHEKNY